MAFILGDEMGGGGPNDEHEDQAAVAMRTGLEAMDDCSEEDSDDYSQTINDIVDKVMTMNKVNKPLPKLVGRLRQSLPHNTRSLAPGIRHLDDASLSSVCHREGAVPYRSTAAEGAPASAHLGSCSTKMVRSVSTPEMSDKYSHWSDAHLSEVDGRKPPASRKMDFIAQGLRGPSEATTRAEPNPPNSAVGDGSDMETEGIKPLKSDWNKENIAPNFSSSWGAGSRDASGQGLPHHHTFKEPTRTNRLALGFKTPGKPAELTDLMPFSTGSCPKRPMPVVSTSSIGRQHSTAGRQVIVSKHTYTSAHPSTTTITTTVTHNFSSARPSTTTTTTVTSSAMLSSTAITNTAATKYFHENVLATSRGVASARSVGSTLYPTKGSAHGALGPSSLSCLSEELYPSAALQGIQPIEDSPYKERANVNLLGRLRLDERMNDVVSEVTSGKDFQLTGDQKYRGSEPFSRALGQTSSKNNDHHGTLPKLEVALYPERPGEGCKEASTSLEDSMGLPTDPNLISALMKLNSSFDAGHSDTLTSYLARQNISASSSTSVKTTQQSVSPEISIVHSSTHEGPATATTKSTSQELQPHQLRDGQFLMPNPYTGRESVAIPNTSDPVKRASCTNNRFDLQPPSQHNPPSDPEITHPSSSSSVVKRQCLSNQTTSSHQSRAVYPSKVSNPIASAGTVSELGIQRPEQQGSESMPKTANCPAKPTVTFAAELYHEPRPVVSRNVDCNEPFHSSNSSEAARSSNSSEAPRSSNSSEAIRSSHTCEAPRSSHTSEAPRSSHTNEAPRSSHTSEAPRSSHTSEAPRSSHTNEAPRSSHTSKAVSSQRPVDPFPCAVPSVPSMEPLFVNGKQYLKLSLLGKGGSSEVFEVLCMERHKVVAVKVVQLDGADDQMLAGYRNEIEMLKQLQWSNRVIKLYDCEETTSDLRLVMERGSKDLACVLKNARAKGSLPISPFTIQHYWQGMLLAVQAIHQQGIVHSDLKPANFILVGEFLKLIDFGIASSIQNDMTSVLKDSQAGTFNYMSPESLNDVHSGPIMNGQAGDKLVIKIGTKSDVWSLGCILYNLVYSRTPFQHINNTWKKLAAISKADTVIEFPTCGNQHLLHTMQLCLQFHPKNRPTIVELLKHPYLTGVGPAGKSNAKPSII